MHSMAFCLSHTSILQDGASEVFDKGSFSGSVRGGGHSVSAKETRPSPRPSEQRRTGHPKVRIKCSATRLDLRRNDNSDHDKYANQATCALVPGGCDGRTISAFNSAPKNLGGYGFGAGDYGTSNDAAAGLLKDSGIGYTLPACAWGKGTGTISAGPDLNPGGGFPFQFMP